MQLTATNKASLIGAIIFAFFVFVYANDAANREEVIEAQARAKLFAIKADLQRHIDEILLITDALASLVHSNPNVTQDAFDQFTGFYQQSHPAILSLQLAPEGIVKLVTNPVRNAAAIGHNLLEGPSTRDSAKMAIETRTKIAVGPVNLLQGGTAMIARQPIFINNNEFWGFATVLVDMEFFLSDHFDSSLAQHFAIRGVDETGAAGAVFFGNAEAFSTSVTTSELMFGNRNWQIAVSDQFAGQVPANLILTPGYWLFALLISSASAWAVYKQLSHRRELETQVHQKTLSLEETLEELQRQNVKRNQLYGMIAHELRTPVSAIAMMSKESNLEEWLENRETIALQSGSLLDTLDDMRMLINPNLKREVRDEPFTLLALSRQIERSTHSLVSSCNFSYSSEIQTAAVNKPYVSDLYRIRVAITNLVRNACLHSEGDSIEVVWNIKPIKSDGEELIVTISDNGKGIPLRKQNSIFEIYQRGETDAPGTGVGLHLAREWIEEIGGVLVLMPYSTGACFQIRVPLKTADSQTNQNADGYETAQDLLASMRVLLVEDDPVLQLLGKKFFSMRARDVDIAGSWGEAQELLATKPFEMIVSDHFLPDKNGDQVVRDARNSGFKGIIIGHTAASLGGQMDELLQAGADAVLPKPLSSEALYECMQQIALARANAEQSRLQGCPSDVLSEDPATASAEIVH